MNKKFISAILAGLMVASVAAIPASAAEVEVEKSGATGKIRFDQGDWDHSHKISFYIWAVDPNDGSTLYGSKDGWVSDNNWARKSTNGTAVEGEDGIVESYEINFDEVAGRDVCVIFYDQSTEAQTYNCILSEACLGQTAVMTGETVENPEDSDKVAIIAAFEGVDGAGPQLKITSTGHVVGSIIAPNENPAKTVAEFVFKNMGTTDKNGEDKVTEDKIADAISKFGTDANAVWTEFQALKGKEGFEGYTDEKEAEAKKIIKPTEEEKSDDNSSKEENKDNNSSNTSGTSSTSGTTKTTTTTSTKTTTTTTTSTTGTASTEAAAATGDTTNTAAFAVVFLAAAAAMFFARKKVEE